MMIPSVPVPARPVPPLPQAGLDGCRMARDKAFFTLGSGPVDGYLQGGLDRGRLHEVIAARGADSVAAAGFALGLALRAGGRGPILWARDGFAAAETGGLSGSGLLEFGASPSRLILVQVRGPDDVMRVADEAARCASLGAVLVEIWGEPRVLGLTATRRLVLAVQATGVTLILLRGGGTPTPSAAMTRWRVESAASRPMEANAPGHPAFTATLLRHRAGLAERTWQIEWHRDGQVFAECAPLSGAVVSASVHGPDPAGQGDAARRRAG